mmetsp:Transcript_129521/g.335969  ORF Transcript_129521/g.335969 Transcript_129521/m.335969 type:complete len:289 (+) Transcript_129521:826-1692(+)
MSHSSGMFSLPFFLHPRMSGKRILFGQSCKSSKTSEMLIRAFASTSVHLSTNALHSKIKGVDSDHDNGGKRPVLMVCSIARRLLPCCVTLPVAVKCTTQPNEKTSAAVPEDFLVETRWLKTSGAIHRIVPPSGRARRVMTRARPKSRSLAWPPSWTRMFELLRSPWTSTGVCTWRNLSAEQIPMMILCCSLMLGNVLHAMYASSGLPSTSSSTKTRCRSSVSMTAPKKRTIFGCLTCRKMRSSLASSRRWFADLFCEVCRGTFNATLVPWRSPLTTTPKPPEPRTSRE